MNSRAVIFSMILTVLRLPSTGPKLIIMMFTFQFLSALSSFTGFNSVLLLSTAECSYSELPTDVSLCYCSFIKVLNTSKIMHRGIDGKVFLVFFIRTIYLVIRLYVSFMLYKNDDDIL